ncbi:hypothetical protein Acr_00g0068360 [Actinidia rufa]|uniref:Uncharacterized protein n=1 Tax=Actinidia rufa TaxID=165716 RepID=A0A7J0DQW9_9ERIC|nr:hypothetical protein Acr_00g0068360 [Actinidia rufa]
MEVLLGDGIFKVDGELWRKQRKTASFEFASKNLRDFSTLWYSEITALNSAILNLASLHGQEVDMQFGARASSQVQDDDNPINGSWVEGHSRLAFIRPLEMLLP